MESWKDMTMEDSLGWTMGLLLDHKLVQKMERQSVNNWVDWKDVMLV